MKRDRFFVKGPLSDAVISFDAEESHHITGVLRKKAGDIITVFNDSGREYSAEITGIRHGIVSARLVSEAETVSEYRFMITAAVSIPKGKRADFMVQKLTELGIHAIIPLECARSVVHAREGSEKFGHLGRTAVESAKQSGRTHVPRIGSPEPLPDVVRKSGIYQLKIIATDRREKSTLKYIMREKYCGTNCPSAIIFLVGPEGGFTEEEITDAVSNGFVQVSLGQTILRTETAAIALTAGLVYELYNTY